VTGCAYPLNANLPEGELCQFSLVNDNGLSQPVAWLCFLEIVPYPVRYSLWMELPGYFQDHCRYNYSQEEHSMDPKFVMGFLIPLVIGILVLVAGVYFWISADRRRKKVGEIDIGDWETTGGKVLGTSVEERESRQNDRTGIHIDISYEPVVDYVYVVKDVELHGNKVFAGKSEKLDQKASQEIINKYPLNSYVAVRYNPENPSESALMPHLDHPDYIQLAGYLLTAFGISVCCFTTFMIFIMVGNIVK
jgi:hypothetical protein